LGRRQGSLFSANKFFSASRYFSLDILHRGIYIPLSRKNSVRRKMMFTFADYTKAMEKFVSATPFEVAENMKPFVEYQAKLSQVAFDAAKKNVEIGQAWVNETIEALDTFAKPAEKPADVAAASTEFARHGSMRPLKRLIHLPSLPKSQLMLPLPQLNLPRHRLRPRQSILPVSPMLPKRRRSKPLRSC